MFWIAFSARIILSLIDVLETKKLNKRLVDGSILSNEVRLYGVNRIRQIPLLVAELIGCALSSWPHYILLPVIIAQLVLVFKDLNANHSNEGKNRLTYDRRIFVLQALEVVLAAAIYLFLFVAAQGASEWI